MQISRLYFPWRPIQKIKMSACYIPKRKLGESRGLEVLKGMSEEEIKEAATPPLPDDDDIWPGEDEYLGYLLEKESTITKHKQNRRKAQENKGIRQRKQKAQIPTALLDEVISFFITYNEMKHDLMSDEEKLALKEFIEETKNRLYHRIKGYKGLNSQVTTLIKLLNEKPAL